MTQKDEEIEKEIEKNDGHFDDFSGKNCDDCTGWTAGEPRCDCGNRRTCWECDQDQDGNLHVWPEAYS